MEREAAAILVSTAKGLGRVQTRTTRQRPLAVLTSLCNLIA